jgi:hypothetical protein
LAGRSERIRTSDPVVPNEIKNAIEPAKQGLSAGVRQRKTRFVPFIRCQSLP